MIILEGPDCGGKSTVSKRWPMPENLKIHFSHQDDKLRVYKRFLAEHQELLLLDRFHLSEQVYGPILRNKDTLALTIRFLERELLARRSCVVLCLPPWEVVQHEWEKRKKLELVQDVEIMRRIYDAYHEIGTALPVVLYDYTRDFFDDLVERVSEFTSKPRAAAGIYGNPDAHIILVGDEPSSPDQHGVPFTRADKGCSIWLAEKLQEGGICESKLAWTNVNPELSTKQIESICRFPCVVALGITAAAKLGEIGVSHALGYHPQYWKRFHHQHPYPLIETIKRLLA